MIEAITLGIIQGVSEWLPISSEGALTLAEIHLFGKTDLFTIIRYALFLHLGTFLAALIYFWNDVFMLIKTLFSYTKKSSDEKNLLHFLAISTFISGLLGLGFLKLIKEITYINESTGAILTIIIGVLLFFTAYLQIRKKALQERNEATTTILDALYLGIAQGFATLPGLSRSGLTVSALMLRGFNSTSSLRLSFLMSLPIVLAGNIILNFSGTVITQNMIVGLIFSFIFGLLTIHGLITFAKRINIGYFVLGFAILMIISGFVIL